MDVVIQEAMEVAHSAGWSSLEARRAHNPKVIGSNPIPATLKRLSRVWQSFLCDLNRKLC